MSRVGVRVSLTLRPQVAERNNRRKRQQQPQHVPRRRPGNAPAASLASQTRAVDTDAGGAGFWTVPPTAEARNLVRTETRSRKAEDAAAEKGAGKGAEADDAAGAEESRATEEMMTGTMTTNQAETHIPEETLPHPIRPRVRAICHHAILGTDNGTTLQRGCGNS